MNNFDTALSLEKKGNYDEAIEIYDYLLVESHDNDRLNILLRKAISLSSNNQYAESAELYKEIINKYDDYRAWNNLGVIYSEINKDESNAIECYLKALSISDAFYIRENLIESYITIGKNDYAINELEKSINFAKDYNEMRFIAEKFVYILRKNK